MYEKRLPDVEKAIEQIHLIYAVGRNLLGLPLMPEERKLTKSELTSTLEAMNEDTVRRAKQFADPTIGYHWQALTSFVRQCREYGYAPTLSVVSRLLNITKEDRKAAQDLVIKNKWGRRDLNTHIKTYSHKTQPIGRKPKSYVDPVMLLAATKQACTHWCRWVEYLPSRSSAAYEQLSPEIKKQLQECTQTVSALGTSVEAALKRSIPETE